MRIKTQKDFIARTDGNVAMMTGIAMVVIVVGVGAAMDYAAVSNNQQQAQDISDALSLAAATDIGRDGKNATLDGAKFAPGKKHKASDFGYDFSRVADGTDIEVEFFYNLETNEVRTAISGYYKPTFASIFGDDKMKFGSDAVAIFPSPDDQHPASIAMVIDTSNSMWYDEDPAAPWDQLHFDTEYTRLRANHNHNTAVEMSRQVPTGNEVNSPNTSQRIVSLRAAFKKLNTSLNESLNDNEDSDYDYLRMGLVPFNHGFRGNKAYNMNWGTIPEHKINGLDPDGETDTSRGMDKARQWLQNEHNRYHRDIRDGLKRYVILMTDGHNSNDRTIQVNKPGSGLWRGQYQHTTPARTDRGRDCEKYETRTRNGGEGGTETYRQCVKWGPRRNREVPAQTSWRWKDVRSPNRPDYGRNWKEIEREDRTRNRCDDFRDKGYDVFTVGYALQAGVYRRNLPGRPSDEYWGVSPDEVDKARDLLQYCATTPDHFIAADNAEQLEQAFEDIGVLISEDSKIRIKS